MPRFILFVFIANLFFIVHCHKDPQASEGEYIVDNQDNWPAWSPDGQTIAYTHFDTDLQLYDSLGKYQIWLINPDGTNKRYVTAGLTPDWSPDSQWLTYSNYALIHKIKVDGSGYQRLTENQDGRHESYRPSWSPKGGKILFQIPIVAFGGIWMMNTDGSGKKNLMSNAEHPSWFDDGRRFVLTQNTGSRWQICIYDTNGTSIDTILSFSHDYAMSIQNPFVSPDQSKVLFTMGTIPTQRAIIYTVNMHGSDLTALTPEGGEGASWSPDGQFICYSHSRRLYTEHIFEHKIWIMDSDGSNKRQLTFE